jgi:hypothetical protein
MPTDSMAACRAIQTRRPAGPTVRLLAGERGLYLVADTRTKALLGRGDAARYGRDGWSPIEGLALLFRIAFQDAGFSGPQSARSSSRDGCAVLAASLGFKS